MLGAGDRKIRAKKKFLALIFSNHTSRNQGGDIKMVSHMNVCVSKWIFSFMFITLLFNIRLRKWLHFASSINDISLGAK